MCWCDLSTHPNKTELKLPKVGYRRYLVIAGRSGGGRLTERTLAVQPRRRERVKVPHCRHCLEPVAGSRWVETGHQGTEI